MSKLVVRRPWWKGKRWWALGISVLIIGAAGCGASENPKRTASETSSQEPQNATPATQGEEPPSTSAQKTSLMTEARWHIRWEGLSKWGLIQTLMAVGYSKADATFAANNVGADWKAEAVEQAQNRLDELEYSKRSLFEHLGADGFTRAQARYAVSRVYE